MADNEKVISIITCDTEGRIETFNSHAEKLFGYTANEVIGKKRVSIFWFRFLLFGDILFAMFVFLLTILGTI